jgi:hypothetical protein
MAGSGIAAAGDVVSANANKTIRITRKRFVMLPSRRMDSDNG